MFKKYNNKDIYKGNILDSGKYVLNPDTYKILANKDIENMTQTIKYNNPINLLCTLISIGCLFAVFTSRFNTVTILLVNLIIFLMETIVSHFFKLNYYKCLYILYLHQDLPNKIKQTVNRVNRLRLLFLVINSIALYLYSKTLNITYFNQLFVNNTANTLTLSNIIAFITVAITTIVLICARVLLDKIKINMEEYIFNRK